jgi:DNA-binding transcriptional LysR family regulator
LALGNINDIAMFVTVVKAGSFTIAAKQLGLTRSAAGKSIVRLEQRLGVRLLNRTPRSLSLTDDGEVFFSRCTQILDDLEETELAMAVRSAKPTGVLRVSVPIGLGHRHVMPVLESFLRAWPDVGAEVSFTDRFVDLIDEGVDIALRIGDPRPDSRLIARTVAQQRLLACASPGYVKTHGLPQTPGDLAGHECLFFMSAGRPQPWVFTDPVTSEVGYVSRLQMDSAEALVAAAVHGFGIINMRPTCSKTMSAPAGSCRCYASSNRRRSPFALCIRRAGIYRRRCGFSSTCWSRHGARSRHGIVILRRPVEVFRKLPSLFGPLKLISRAS